MRRVKNYIIGREWLNYPQNIQFNTQNHCNLSCAYCNVKRDGAYKEKRGVMDESVFYDTIDMVKPYSKHVKGIALFMNGEPLLEDRFTEFTSYLMKHTPYYGIVDSNGTIPRRASRFLHPQIRKIRISLSAHDRELYKQVHGADKFNEVCETLRFLKKNRLSHQELYINHMVNKHNEIQLSLFLENFKEYTINVFPLHSSSLQTNSLKNISTTVKEPIQYRPDGSVIKLWDSVRGYKPCQCWDLLGIGLNGEIMHCVDYPAEYNYGTIYETEIKKAWDTRNRIGVKHELCRTCSLNLERKA